MGGKYPITNAAPRFDRRRFVKGLVLAAGSLGPARMALGTLFRYSHEQGLAKRRLKVEDVFQPGSLDFQES